MPQLNNLTGRRVLVTGASGILGSRAVAILSDRGCIVHALVRKTSRVDHLDLPNVKIFYGDIADAGSLRAAFEGADFVIHTAADTTGNAEKGKLSTIQGTQNILDLSREFDVKKLVYISSCNVYGIADYRKGEVVNEDSSLERFPEKRGHYSLAKLKAEQIVLKAMEEGQSIVCLRPGTYFSPGSDIFTPMMGFSAGRMIFVIIGMGSFVLPIVSVENLIDAIVTCLLHQESNRKVFNVVNDEMPTKKQYVESFLKKLFPKAIYLYIPYWIIYGITRFQEILFGIMRKNPLLTVYRLESSQKKVIYDASKIRKELNWTSPVTLQETYEQVIKYEKEKSTRGQGLK